MWFLKALALWTLISLVASGFIGHFLAGKYMRRQSKPRRDSGESSI